MKVEPLGNGHVKVTADCGCSMKTGEMFTPCTRHAALDAQEYLDHMESFRKEADAAVDMYNKRRHSHDFTKRDDEGE